MRFRPGRKSPSDVALTGYGQDVERSRPREAGFYQNFVKPVDPSQLLRGAFDETDPLYSHLNVSRGAPNPSV